MNYSDVEEAKNLIEVLGFVKLCRRPGVYSNSELLALKSYTSGTPEFKLKPSMQDVVLKAIEAYSLARLTELGIEPDPDTETEAGEPP